MAIKSERLKKLEKELEDLEKWLKLGLVPSVEEEKHKVEIGSIRKKIGDEHQRLQHLKDQEDGTEFVIPKKNQGGRAAYQEHHTIPDVNETSSGFTETGLDMSTETHEMDTATNYTDSQTAAHTTVSDDDDPFSDKNRWKRGILEDPDSDSW
ncbi:hypothetical protein COB21_05490 [Candidatus Aerophobetes bacterium]|uniref:Uncharacterized protein n=1 Tax=Aerophobetes bacterium TaxID=2030807 RepID=A0A2A4WZD9_UNCAE|nr:MAG: hypothetical protein COB21_05490 [Candidatus Aerophobetes bacterium]